MLIVIDRIESLKIMKDRLIFSEKEYKKTKDFNLMYEIQTLKAYIKKEALFFFSSEKQKYQVATVIYYMMLLLKYDLIKLKREGEECK